MSEFENFEEIEANGALKNNLVISNVYSARIGGFGSESNIRTYLTTLNVSELKEDIAFYDTLSKEKDWPVSQIIQREVDKIRVNSITKKYLLGKGRHIKYFPPIIIALLPKTDNGDFSKTYVYIPDQTNETKTLIFDKSRYRTNDKFKEVLLKTANSSNVDGLFVYEVSKVFEQNLICWDKSKFYSVVIDGQHRLDSLLRGKEEEPTFENAIQDVVFLDVSALVQKKPEISPVEVLRTIFIDINTNAKSVGFVRRVLIDDKDLASLCVQSLVDSINKDGTNKTDDMYIPSVLIDWHGESLKHELPHITGVLTIFQILSDELISTRLVTIDDHRNHNKIKGFIDLLNGYFFVDQTIKNEAEFQDVIALEKSLEQYFVEKSINKEIFSQELLDDDLIDSILFNYDYRTLDIAQRNFEKFYLRSIKNIFTDFLPYSLAIKYINSREGFNSHSNLYKALLTSKMKILRNAPFKEIYLEVRLALQKELNKNYNLFFLVVGQKALFKIFFEFLFKKIGYGVKEEFILEYQREFIGKINDLVFIFDKAEFFLFGNEDIDLTEDLNKYNKDYLEFGTVASSFWEGILFEDKRIIYNSQGVRALADVIILIFDFIDNGKEVKNYTNSTIRFAILRTKRLLKKRFSNRSDEEFDKIARNIINFKKQFLYEKVMSTLG